MTATISRPEPVVTALNMVLVGKRVALTKSTHGWNHCMYYESPPNMYTCSSSEDNSAQRGIEYNCSIYINGLRHWHSHNNNTHKPTLVPSDPGFPEYLAVTRPSPPFTATGRRWRVSVSCVKMPAEDGL